MHYRAEIWDIERNEEVERVQSGFLKNVTGEGRGTLSDVILLDHGREEMIYIQWQRLILGKTEKNEKRWASDDKSCDCYLVEEKRTEVLSRRGKHDLITIRLLIDLACGFRRRLVFKGV